MGNSFSNTLVRSNIISNGSTRTQYQFKWKVANFATVTPGVGHSVDSQWLRLSGKDEWQVILYPEGFNERLEGYVSLWLKRKSNDVEQVLSCACAIEDSEGNELMRRSDDRNLTLESTVGWANFCHRSLILEDGRGLLDGALSLKFTLDYVTFTEFGNAAIEGSEFQRTFEVCKSMKELLSTGSFADLTIVSGTDVFPAHKAVLSARSKVFSAMLHSRLTVDNLVVMDDISPFAVREMLRFVYAGELGDLPLNVIAELFYAADKYELMLLKNLCSKVLARNLCVSNALQTLLLAERHQDFFLKHTAVRFIADNIHGVQKLSEWITFMSAHPALANAVVEYLGA